MPPTHPHTAPSPGSDPNPPTTAVADESKLHEFGYEQKLKRGFSFFGMIGFAFSVLTCWTALAGSLIVAIGAGGPPVIIYSWIGVCVFSLAVAYSFAEICSAFPVAGGQVSSTKCPRSVVRRLRPLMGRTDRSTPGQPSSPHPSTPA